MQSSSPTPLNYPSTPGPSHKHYPSSIPSYQPIHSSPLAESPKSSPVISAQRRRSGYKTSFPPITSFNAHANDVFGTAEEPQKAFLRERFKARCFERAKKDREKARRRVSTCRSRSSDGSVSEASSDAEMDSEGEEEDEETTMEDELFRRIMINLSRKQKHSYRLSYSYEVGSSIDPDMEDVRRWEDELREDTHLTPQDLDDEELQAYAEEYATLADFDDVVEGEWSLSDLEDIDSDPQGSSMAPPPGIGTADVDVDMS